MIHPVEFVYKSLTSMLIPFMPEPENVHGKCSCCERPAEAFGSLGYRFMNSYRQPVMHCLQCQTFFVSAPDILGLESPKKISSQRFGMWPGVGVLINIQKCSPVLLAPPGVVNKLPSLFFEKVNVITATASQQPEYLFNADLRYPFIYIQDFGRKTYELVRSLRISYSSDAVYACCDTLMTHTNEANFIINLEQAKALHAQMKNLGRRETNIFIRTVELLVHGRISPVDASDIFKKNDMAYLVRMLPADPHQRMTLLRILKKVL
ncbi:hypothetical protein FGH87_26160 [Salmonella enterica]|uniref:Uncharacterized protein n=1 Tax=Salmonella enterica subsp. enterica serovar Lattenkamp TaxID=2564671 RepID=A0A5W2M0L1_SALET|nr:hypothetical protein [Salmonella enterica subsp. enterica serovar Lattenkamp]EAQ8610870.1 hypothetical protein [Salmonella enterica]ECJ3925562.1 hypothetical protein [Salmonella enterica subsp. enterica]EAR5597597.1 hypothetical protein [Salmonella enterica]EAV2737490.1 hypothetical protein [Salmonella enterica]